MQVQKQIYQCHESCKNKIKLKNFKNTLTLLILQASFKTVCAELKLGFHYLS